MHAGPSLFTICKEEVEVFWSEILHDFLALKDFGK